ncbi:hypothetical protein BJY24_000785 [Nocardia transvalensis]|uniref:SnoaL-like domain-containing protein n=1 Tax=Nocardia transvalensis TaxID=37333 RepID=A0A7W9P9Z2_9NOCA|nr:nuclear transport factor 2 family protein [Nocardia transvalensis]MBB5911918.1 hypothetical protein [Nocardia transvalensis]
MSAHINWSLTGRRALRTAAVIGTAVVIGAGASVAGAGPAEPPGVYSAADTAAEFQAITQLKTNYFADIDAKNWAALRELLAPDVVVDTTGSAGPVFTNRDQFIVFLQLTLGAAQTHHQGFDPQIEVISPTEAKAVWRMEDVLIFGGVGGVHGYGWYQDEYRKVDGAWVVTYSKLTRSHIDLVRP